MRNGIAIAGSALLMTGCVSAPLAQDNVPATPPVISTSGLERVLGHDARSLVAQLGQPELDVREGSGRKLQFAGPICVLDAYLYPKSGREPVVTYVDARQPDGRDIDRASCVAALIANRKR
jgi:hypothetical protein